MSEQKRNIILESALKVFSEKGFHTASMDEIARESNISKGGLYFYFPSKTDIFSTLIRELGESLVERLGSRLTGISDPEEKLQALLDGIIEIFVKYQGLARFLLIESFISNPEFGKERQRVIKNLEELVAGIIKEGKDNGIFREDTDEKLVASLWIGAVHHLIIEGLIDGDLERVRNKKESLKEYLLQGGIKR